MVLFNQLPRSQKSSYRAIIIWVMTNDRYMHCWNLSKVVLWNLFQLKFAAPAIHTSRNTFDVVSTLTHSIVKGFSDGRQRFKAKFCRHFKRFWPNYSNIPRLSAVGNPSTVIKWLNNVFSKTFQVVCAYGEELNAVFYSTGFLCFAPIHCIPNVPQTHFSMKIVGQYC